MEMPELCSMGASNANSVVTLTGHQDVYIWDIGEEPFRLFHGGKATLSYLKVAQSPDLIFAASGRGTVVYGSRFERYTMSDYHTIVDFEVTDRYLFVAESNAFAIFDRDELVTSFEFDWEMASFCVIPGTMSCLVWGDGHFCQLDYRSPGRYATVDLRAPHEVEYCECFTHQPMIAICGPETITVIDRRMPAQIHSRLDFRLPENAGFQTKVLGRSPLLAVASDYGALSVYDFNQGAELIKSYWSPPERAIAIEANADSVVVQRQSMVTVLKENNSPRFCSGFG
jgi:hypothetical protein